VLKRVQDLALLGERNMAYRASRRSLVDGTRRRARRTGILCIGNVMDYNGYQLGSIMFMQRGNVDPVPLRDRTILAAAMQLQQPERCRPHTRSSSPMLCDLLGTTIQALSNCVSYLYMMRGRRPISPLSPCRLMACSGELHEAVTSSA